jgi:hypothetical protein
MQPTINPTTKKTETIELTAAEYAEFKAILAERALAKHNDVFAACRRRNEFRDMLDDFNRYQTRVEKKDLIEMFANAGVNDDDLAAAQAACIAEHQANMKRYKVLLVELCKKELAISEPADAMDSAPEVTRERFNALNEIMNLVGQSKYKNSPNWQRLTKHQEERNLLRRAAEQRYIASLIKRVNSIADKLNDDCDSYERGLQFFELINTSPKHSNTYLRAAACSSAILNPDMNFATHLNGMTHGIPHSIHSEEDFPYVKYADEITEIQEEMCRVARDADKYKYKPDLAFTIKEVSGADNVTTWNIECVREFEKRRGLKPWEI